MREITKERVKKLLNDWKKAGWMELISRYNKVFDILPTEDFFWEMGDRYPHEIFKAEVQRRGERYARVNRNAIHVVDVMFVILPDEVMNEWAEWLAKKSFDLTATGIFSVELPAKQLGLIQACTPRSTINRLYSLRNGFWLSESPWAYVGTMHDDWPRMILTAMRQLVMENDPAAAFKTARAAQKASLCTRTFPEMTANWFYGQILYANRDVPKRVLR